VTGRAFPLQNSWRATDASQQQPYSGQQVAPDHPNAYPLRSTQSGF